MADFEVTTTSDSGADATVTGDLAAEFQDGAGLSLREALILSNDNGEPDSITFADGSGEAFENANTIIELDSNNGPLVLTSDVTVAGGGKVTIRGAQDVDPGMSLLEITGGHAAFSGLTFTGADLDTLSAVSVSGQGTYLTLDNATLTNNNSLPSVSGDASPNSGAALSVFDYAGARITNTSFVNNSAYSPSALRVGYGSVVNVYESSFVSNSSVNNDGGAVYVANGGLLTATNSLFESNSSVGDGGAIYIRSGGEFRATDTLFLSNDASYLGDGGAIFTKGTLHLIGTTFVLNSVYGLGGAIATYSGSTTQIEGSTFYGNYGALTGGAIANNGALDLSNSTIYSNTSDLNGSAVYSRGATTIRNATIFNNQGGSGYAVDQNGGSITLENSIVTGNTGGVDDVGNSVQDVDNSNLIGVSDDLVFETGELADNGGPVQTIALRRAEDNPALDASKGNNIPPADARGVLALDQPGINNDGPVSGIRDIGAYELNSLFNNSPTLDIGDVALPDINAGAADPAGVLIGDLLPDGSISDEDGVYEGIAVTALDTSLGFWQYRLDGSEEWLTINSDLINSETNELALLLGPTASLRLLPFDSLSGTLDEAVTFRAWDGFEGVEGGYFIINETGDTRSFSEASAPASIEVLSGDNSAPTFVTGDGKALVNVTEGIDNAYSVALQPDGKVLVAGTSIDGSERIGIIRLNPDGTLDDSFNADGKVLVDVVAGPASDSARSVSLQSDGKVLVAGFSLVDDLYEQYSIVRLNVDGTLDEDFGVDGKVLVDVGPFMDFGRSVIPQPDGKLLVAGESYVDPSDQFSIIRLNANGSLDEDFGDEGRVLVDVSEGGDEGTSVVLQADGKVLLVGSSLEGSGKFSVVRFNVDGTLDDDFGMEGKVLVDVSPGNDTGRSVALQQDGKVLVAGTSADGSNKFSVIRLDTNGVLDTSFGTDGKTLVDVGADSDFGFAINLQPDGKVLVAGESLDGSRKFAIIRLDVDGTLDESFGVGGKVLASVGSTEDFGRSVTLQPDGKILMAGYSIDDGAQKFSVIRLNADGTPDLTFGEATASLTGALSYTENQTIALDTQVAVVDRELGNDFGGASLTIERLNEPAIEDTFSRVSGSPVSAFTEGSVLTIGGAEVAEVVKNSGGTLQIEFLDGATQGQVNTVLSSVAYQNTSDTPPNSITLQWTFNDGNTGDQGDGGALSATAQQVLTVTQVNDGPKVVSPIPDVTVKAGEPVDLPIPEGTLLDPEGDPLTYIISGPELPGWLEFDTETGKITGTPTQEDGGTLSLRIRATDETGRSTTDVFELTVRANALPAGEVLITGDATEGEILTASNTLTDADDLGEITYQWFADGEAISDATTDELELTQELVGQEITVTASYTDGFDTDESVSSDPTVPVSNVNDDPEGTVTITGDPTQGETLTASNDLSDADGLGEVSYQWFANDEAISDATADTLELTQDQVGATITVTASYTDEQGTGESVSSDPTEAVVNVNDDPEGDVTITGDPVQGAILTASNDLTDLDGLGAITYQWFADGDAISDATTDSLELTQDLVGAVLTVTASYEDDGGEAESVTSEPTAAVTNSNDEPEGEVTITGDATQGQTLTAINTLTDADGLGAITYQWFADGEAISDATTDTLDLTQAEVGALITVIASYEDGFGNAEAVSSDPTDAVANVNDDPEGDVIITGDPTQGQTLTASNTLADADGLGDVTYQWFADGEAISDATTETLDLTQTEVGATITVTASYTDGQGTDESVESDPTAAVANVNDDPEGTVTITGDAIQAETLTASNDLTDLDGLGDISYQWLRDGEAILDATEDSYLLTADDVDAEIKVQAIYTDGGATEERVTSAAVIVVTNNTPPTGMVTLAGIAAQFETLTASNTLADVDGLGPITYQWFADGEAISDATTDTLELTQSEVGKAVTVTASYTDGLNVLTEVSSEPSDLIANVNEAPAFDIPALAVDIPDIDGVYPASFDGTVPVTDPDGDVLAFTLQEGVIDEEAGTATTAGRLGTLTLDTVTGTYSYALDADAVAALDGAADLFVITVTDGEFTDTNVLVIGDFGDSGFTVDDPNDDGLFFDATLVAADGERIDPDDTQLYRTYAGILGRDPDAEGFDWWANEIETGNYDLRTATEGFLWSEEFLGFFPDVARPDEIGSDEFVQFIYEGIFGRAPDAPGFTFWTNELETGNKDQAQVVLEMTQSNEFIGLSSLAAIDYLL